MDTSDIILLAGCPFPILIAVSLSWLLIHKKRTVLGVLAGPTAILLLLVLFTALMIFHERTWYNPKADPLYDVALEVDAFLFWIAVLMAGVDSAIVFCANVLLVIIYKRLRHHRAEVPIK